MTDPKPLSCPYPECVTNLGAHVDPYDNNPDMFCVTCFDCDAEGPGADSPAEAVRLWDTVAGTAVSPQRIMLATGPRAGRTESQILMAAESLRRGRTVQFMVPDLKAGERLIRRLGAMGLTEHAMSHLGIQVSGG